MPRLLRRRARRHVVVGAAVLAVLAVIAGGLAVMLVQRGHAEHAAAEEAARAYRGPTPTAPTSRIVSVISDQLALGRSGLVDATTWPSRMGVSLGVRVFVDVPGGSYSRSASKSGPTFVNAAGLVAPRADVVVVFGGRGDAGIPRKRLLDDAARVYASITSTAPSAKLIVVGPLAAPEAPDAQVLAVRDALRTATGRTHAQFVDPIADGWFADVGGSFRSDGSLTTSGEQRMAGYVAQSVSAALR